MASKIYTYRRSICTFDNAMIDKISHFQWIHIPGKLKWISSGSNIVVGVNSNNDIFYRKGMSAGRPTGTGWVRVPGKLMQIEVYGNEVVGTNPGHVIFRAPVTGVSSLGTGNRNSLNSNEGISLSTNFPLSF